MFRRTVILVGLLFGAWSFANAQPVQQPVPTARDQKAPQKAAAKPDPQPTEEILSNDSIIQLLKVGLSEDLVIAKIQKSKYSFDTSTSGLIALKQAGVSDRLLHFMMDPTKPPQPTSLPPMPVTNAPASPTPRVIEALFLPKTGDPIADNVPQEPGL